MHPEPGTLIAGKYRIERVLGRGGMGIVVEATHMQLEVRVALKFLDESMVSDATAVARFTREAKASAQLRSEHVCRVTDFGIEGRVPYIVMELLAGTDLARLCKVRTLDVPTAALYIQQACRGLAEAHAIGIVHRDLKPGNLFVTRRADGSPLIKVLDFGVAKAPVADDVGLTGTSNVVGSPGYLSPEQVRSSRSVDGRSDIWSLGVILYKLVSGRLPFRADGFAEFSLAITTTPMPPLAGVPPAFEQVVARCLAKDAANRYPDVTALADDLAPFAAQARTSAPSIPTDSDEPPSVAMPAAPPVATAATKTLLGPAGAKAVAATSESVVKTFDPRAQPTAAGSMIAVPRFPHNSGDLAPGTLVGEYRIEAKIGEGGMGAVYAAVHPLIGKKAAIKVIAAELGADPVVVQRFVQEARTVNQIGHPNIVDVFAFGKLPDGRNYFVMDLLQGESLRARTSRVFIPLAEALQIFDETAGALQAAHEQQIVHRDLKPDNVFLAQARRHITVKLLDFGIAKLAANEGGISKTSTGELIGTPAYLSPEQARNKNVDYRTDIYALGVMMFEIVTGRLPFIADSAMDIVMMHITEQPRRPRELKPELPQPLDQLIVQMLDKNPDRRPSLAEVRNVFAELVASGAVPIEPGSGTTFRSDLARSAKELEARTPRSSTRNQALDASTSERTRVRAEPQPAATASAQRRAASPSDAPTHIEFTPGPNTIAPSTAAQTIPQNAARPRGSKRRIVIIAVALAMLVPTASIAYALLRGSTTPASADAAVAMVAIDAQVAIAIDASSAVVPVDAAPELATREVTIHVNVANARIEIDGSQVTGSVATLTDGPHKLVATAPGHAPMEKSIDVSPALTKVEVVLGKKRTRSQADSSTQDAPKQPRSDAGIPPKEPGDELVKPEF